MKILTLLTYVQESSWGYRLHNSFNTEEGVESRMLCLRDSTGDNEVYEIIETPWDKIALKVKCWFEQKILFSKNKETVFSSALLGVNLKKKRVQEQLEWADVICIHWVNGCFLTLKDIKYLNNLDKIVVWQFYDSWPFTGGCHVRNGCEKYILECGSCPLLNSNKENDITKKILKLKRKHFSNETFNIITPSKYIKDQAIKNRMFAKSNFKIINHGEDKVYRLDKNSLREQYGLSKEKTYILFGATSTKIGYKGFEYLKNALNILDLKDTEIITFGNDEVTLENFKVNNLGFINSREKLMEIYSLSDVFVGPSLEESFGLVFLEAMCCGVPSVCFENTGAATDIVQHKHTGYIAKYKNSEDLAEGIKYALLEKTRLQENCYKVAEDKFMLKQIVKEYMSYFTSLGA
ncbi:MAG: glycosyltransferase [Pseudomonadales bacterium]|nr:glycosyltransferase [Pseudomonadales bacterium]